MRTFPFGILSDQFALFYCLFLSIYLSIILFRQPGWLYLVFVSLTSFLYFPWVPCTCNSKTISAYLSELMFTLEEQWQENSGKTQTPGLVGSTHVGLLTKTDIVKWATLPHIKATTILHT